jgi:hypothetical protein
MVVPIRVRKDVQRGVRTVVRKADPTVDPRVVATRVADAVAFARNARASGRSAAMNAPNVDRASIVGTASRVSRARPETLRRRQSSKAL